MAVLYYQYPANNFGGNYVNPNLMSNTSNFGNTSNYVNTSNPQVGNQLVQNPVQSNDVFNNMHVPVYNNSQILGMYGDQAQDFHMNQFGQAHLPAVVAQYHQTWRQQNQILVNQRQGQNQAIPQDRRMVQNHPDQHWDHHDHNQAMA